MKDQTKTDQRNCGTCRHAIPEQMQGQIMRQLVCHQGPPIACMVTMPGPGGQMGVQGVTMFPVVQPTMFCAQWQPVELQIPVAKGSE